MFHNGGHRRGIVLKISIVFLFPNNPKDIKSIRDRNPFFLRVVGTPPCVSDDHPRQVEEVESSLREPFSFGHQ